MRQRRWAERGRFEPVVGAHQHTKRDTEQVQQRLLIIGAAVFGVILVALVGLALYIGVFAPPRRIVAKVGQETVRLRDVPPYLLLNTTTQGAPTPRVAFTSLIRERIILQRAGSLGVSISDEEIDRAVVQRFEDQPEGSEGEVPTVLSPDGQRAFDQFVGIVGISKERYREWAEGQLLFEALRQHFNTTQPDEMEQVFVRWIIPQDSANAQKAKERLDAGEPFADVAAELHVGIGLTDESGELGWVPRGAFPELDEAFFDSEIGAVPEPLTTSAGSIVILVEKGPETQPLTDEMRELLGSNAFQAWMDDEVGELLTDFSFTNEDSNWVLQRLAS